MMGAFCVFGVSRQVCRKQAESKVKTIDKETGHHLSVVEWGDLVRAEGDRMFEVSVKQVRISPEFDAPQFCYDWLAVSPGEVRLTRVMVRGPKTDKNDRPMVRNGAPVMTWLPYEAPSRLTSTARAGGMEARV
jgi:hypothetical protein